MPFRILCADESLLTQQGLDSLCKQEGCSIDRFVASLDDLNQALASEHFDVLVCEARLGTNEAMDFSVELRKSLKDLKVILYTHVINPTLVAQAVANQFYDVVLKTGASQKIVDSLLSLEAGSPPERSLLTRFRSFMTQSEWTIPAIVQNLTKRELQIMVHLALGLSNREIAGALRISLETVKEHVQNVLRKLKVSDRTAAAVWALKNQIPTVTIEASDLL